MQWGLSVKMIRDDPLFFLAWAIPTSTAGNTPRYSLVFAQGVRFHRTRWPARLGQGGQNTGRCGSTDPQYFLIIPTLLGDSRFLDMPVFCFCQANGNCFPYGKKFSRTSPGGLSGDVYAHRSEFGPLYSEVASLILGDLWHLHDDMLVTFYLPNGKFTILGIFWDNFSMLLGHLKQIPVIVADIGT